MISATYRQSSRADGRMGLAVDAGTRLLWRFPPRRLEAEAIRDAMLAVSGKLDLSMGGPGFDLSSRTTTTCASTSRKPSLGPETVAADGLPDQSRMQQDATFGAFDCPDAGQIAPQPHAPAPRRCRR